MCHCRSCKTLKTKGDPCPGCGRGLPVHTMRSVTKPIAVKAHGFHALNAASTLGYRKAL